MNKKGEALTRLVEIMRKLRDPKSGCPWDLKQDHQSLKQYLIEEAYEVIEAIDQCEMDQNRQNKMKLCAELGDLLLQVVFHAQLADEAADFTIDDVSNAISEKLITRHPHVFGETKVSGSEEVLKNWEQIKKSELKGQGSIMDGVPKSMPALLRAQRIGDKAARVGFEWPTLEGVRDKVFEEMSEFLKCSCTDANKDSPDKLVALKDEFGDILFALSQLARRLDFNSEELLHQASSKFSRRFCELEKLAGKDLKEFNIAQLDKLWNQVKSRE